VKKKKIPPEKPQPQRFRRYEALIFITGAVTLSLEVLASRIMTPYFGVSLYIWAGILSITLIFLALGYQLGGWISQRRDRDGLQLTLLAAPLWAALSIVVATAVYPAVFPLLSRINLIIASFVGGTILLAIEHVWHGEVVPWPPFLTAMENPADIPEMLHEMATVGGTMAGVITAVWGILVLVARRRERRAIWRQEPALEGEQA